ncbi:unnamed protein product [Bemisia tabaci]|uniref:Activating molecule in BECN1-regulated autophagy protein 1 n=2 Tax=Bemisia tabaci TaxID=7038 RepID=A0A9P0F3X7_BEMTA|nr:unnamed protein product [Bemisia tabaci]
MRLSGISLLKEHLLQKFTAQFTIDKLAHCWFARNRQCGVGIIEHCPQFYLYECSQRMLDSEDEDANSDLDKRKHPYSTINRSVPKACFIRENGSRSQGAKVAKEFEWAAEDIFVQKSLNEHKFELPENARSTFLMVFSPDGKIVASTHGNHSIYVTDVRTCKTIRTLNGHPRTPWCIAFHPSSNQILASGCLGGEVRVWDLHGGSEVWTSDCHTVIASLAFHPIERVLVIATYNELYFWDWNERVPFAKCRTGHEKEKIRYVAFDHLGQKLITGIANVSPLQSQWDRIANPTQNDTEDCLRRMLNRLSWHTSPRRQAAWEARRLQIQEAFRSPRHNLRPLNVRRLGSPVDHLRRAFFNSNNLNTRERDRTAVENYLLGNRDFTFNDFISVVRSQSERNQFDGDHSYSESEQAGSVEYWRILLDFFFDEQGEYGWNERDESLFTDHDYSVSRETFARSRHSWWSRNFDEELPMNSTAERQPRRNGPRWTRAPLPTRAPLRPLRSERTRTNSAGNEVMTPGGAQSASFIRDVSRLQSRLRRLQRSLTYLETRRALSQINVRSDSSSASSVPSNRMQGLAPLVLQPLSDDQQLRIVTSSSNLLRLRMGINNLQRQISRSRITTRLLLPSTRQRLQEVLQRLHTRLSRFQTLTDDPPLQSPLSSINFNSRVNGDMGGASSSHWGPGTLSSAFSSDLQEGPSRVPSSIEFLSGEQSTYFEERIKSLRQLSDANRSSNPASDSSQEPRAFQRYTHSPKPSCSNINDAGNNDQHPKADSSDRKQLSYFEKLKAKFAQLSRQIKEQCSTSTEFTSNHWQPSSSTQPNETPSNNNDSNPSNRVSPAEGNETSHVGSSDTSADLSERINNIVSNIRRVGSSLSRSMSCEFDAGSSKIEPRRKSDSGVSGESPEKNSEGSVDRGQNNSQIPDSTSVGSSLNRLNSEDSPEVRGSSYKTSSPSNSRSFDRVNSEGSSGTSSFGADNELRPAFVTASSLLGSLKQSSSLSSSSTSSNESWQGPVSEVGTTAGATPTIELGTTSPSQETRRIGLKRKLDSIVSSARIALQSRTVSPLSSTCDLRPDLVTPSPGSRADLASNDLFLTSSSSSSSSDSSSTSSSDSDSQDPTYDSLQNLFRVLKQRTDSINRSFRNQINYAPQIDPPTSAAARLQATLSDSSRYMESLFGGPSGNVDGSSPPENRPALDIGAEIRTHIQLFQDALSRLSQARSNEERLAGVPVLQKILRLLFYLIDLWLGQLGYQPEGSETGQSSSVNASRLAARERILLIELASETSLPPTPLQEREPERLSNGLSETSNRNDERPPAENRRSHPRAFARRRRDLMRNHRLLWLRERLRCVNANQRRRQLAESIDARRQEIRSRLNESRRRLTERMGEHHRQLGEREERRQQLSDRLEEGRRQLSERLEESQRLLNERLDESRRQLNERMFEQRRQMRDSMDQVQRRAQAMRDAIRRTQCIRDPEDWRRERREDLRRLCQTTMQAHSGLRSLVAAIERGHETSTVSSAELFRGDERSNSNLSNRDSQSTSQQPSVPFRLLDPILQQFNNSRPSSVSPQQPHKNLVVADCKIYNDASVDISSDSSLLVTLLPSSRFGFTCMLGIYSLEWETLGQRLYQVSFEQNAVSVSLSPTCRYLVVGLSARRRISLGTETDTIAQILQLDGGVPSKHNSSPQRGKLTKVRGLELYRELSSMSLNCIRWAPTPGQGIVCGTNTGQLTFLR